MIHVLQPKKNHQKNHQSFGHIKFRQFKNRIHWKDQENHIIYWT